MSAFSDEHWMRLAIAQARQAELQGEVPIGAVLVKDNQLISEGWNQPIGQQDPTAHAEIKALREGAKVLGNYRLLETTLYVTLEPCVMCVGALLHARVSRLVFGAGDSRNGAVQTQFHLLENNNLNHKVDWQGGICKTECATLLKDFFQQRR